MGLKDYEKQLNDLFLEHFGKELEKVQNDEVDVQNLIRDLYTLKSHSEEVASESEFFNIDQVNVLIEQSFYLLDHLQEYDQEVADDVIAAISYFVNEDDAISDDNLLEGFDDDYAIMEAVVEFRNLGGPISKK